MIVSQQKNRLQQLTELKTTLIKLNYPVTLIDHAFCRAAQNGTQRSQLEGSSNNRNNKVPFICTYNKNNPNVYRDVILPISNAIKQIPHFDNCEIYRSYRQPPNLIRLLNHNNRPTIKGITRCEEARCGCCDLLITGNQISLKNNEPFKIKTNMSCTSKNLIYVLRCKSCGDFYIGQTGDVFRTRITVHRQQISSEAYRVLAVSRHIAQCARGPLNINFEAAPIYQMHPSASRMDRELKEQHFISMLCPPLNK